MSTAEQVLKLAEAHNVTIPTGDSAHDFAVAVNRLEAVEGDDTMVLIAQLLKGGHISVETAGELTLAHSREIDAGS